jgi:hypothetical protein
MEVNEPLLYLGRGWILHVRQMLADAKARLWVERTWVPAKQRQGDVSLMESFTGHPDLNINKRTLLLAITSFESGWGLSWYPNWHRLKAMQYQ